MSERCRHERHSWLIGSAQLLEWCYRCGAIRSLRNTGGNTCAPAGPWQRPTGPNGENPHGKYMAAFQRFSERRSKP